MLYQSMFGNDLGDFIEQLPEKLGISKIPESQLIIPREDDAVVCKASKSTQMLLMRIGVLCDFGEDERAKVAKSDSLSKTQAFNADINENLTPVLKALAGLLSVQINLDVRAAGGDASGHTHYCVDRNLNIVNLKNCLELGARLKEVLPA